MSLLISDMLHDQQRHSGPSIESSEAGEGRPYRSHKIPACDRCRKRKLRCAVDVPGQPCYACRTSGASCVHIGKEISPGSLSSENMRQNSIAPAPSNQPAKRRQTGNQDRSSEYTPNQHVSLSNPSSIFLSLPQNRRQKRIAQPPASAEPGSKSALIVGPVMAEDVQLVQDFISSQSRLHRAPPERLYDTVSDNPQDPVLYLTVPRRRLGLSLNYRPGEKQREILEQILGPFIDEVIALYFEYIHPSFPVMDEEHFLHLYKTGNKSLSAALVCELIASSLVYWYHSKNLRQHPCPDVRYVWNLAVAALQEEFLAPGMSTVHAALLDLNGRPTTSITGNTINSGRTIGLSHILGLNRDPWTWKISDSEKNTRVRLWWGVLIHDRWSSFAHGVPTYITKNQYEVPVPSVSILMTNGLETKTRLNAAKCFIALCTLTEILGDILPLVYERRQRAGTEISKVLRRLETDLDNWEDSWPVASLLRDRGDAAPVSGSSSLRLGFLSAKMLICRIAFRNATHSAEPGLAEMQQYSQAMLRESARAITTFLCTLKPHHLCEFWSPYTAYHITSATIILLRCAIETKDPLISESCKASLLSLVEWLRTAKEEHQWDLGEICLAQCEGPILQICGELNRDAGDALTQSAGLEAEHQANVDNEFSGRAADGLDPGMLGFNSYTGGFHTGPSVMDTQHDVNGYEYPWADLWDLF